MNDDVYVTCPECSEEFKSKCHLKDHMLSNHNIIAFTCNLCPKIFFNKELEYINHFDSDHRLEFQRHTCQYCGLSYKWFKFLHKHIKDKHQIERLQRCPECGEEFYNDVAFIKHKKQKHLEGRWKFYKCETCKRGFTSKDFLLLHMKFDHGSSVWLSFKDYVQKHYDIDEEVFVPGCIQCRKCNIAFTSYIYLLKHYKTAHSKLKYFYCCVCDTALYNTRAGLGIHLYHEHMYPREHRCLKCIRPRGKPKTKVIKKHKEETKEIKPTWTEAYIRDDLPNDIDLVNVTDVQVINLRSNIQNMFHVLSTVPPSKLKGSIADPYKQFYIARKKLSIDLRKDGRRRANKYDSVVIKTKMAEYHCDICRSVFKDKKKLAHHIKIHEGSKDKINNFQGFTEKDVNDTLQKLNITLEKGKKLIYV